MSLFRVVTGLAVACSLLGCSSPPAGPAPSTRATEEDPTRSALQAVEQRNWAAAGPLLKKALQRAPENVRLHYMLGTTATYVGPREEAVREFQWVVAHARAGSEEAIAARAWLVEAGAVADSRPTPSPSVGSVTSEATAESGVSGRVLWGEAGRMPSVRARMQVHLIGLRGGPTAGRRYTVRTDEAGRFTLAHLVPGAYKITDRIAGPPTWRLRLDLAAGQSAQLDLTPTNSLRVRDDFRDDPTS